MKITERTPRIIALLAMLSLLLVLFVGCGEEQSESKKKTTAASADTSAVVTESGAETTTTAAATIAQTTALNTTAATTTKPTTTTPAATTTTTPKPTGASWYKNAAWNDDGVLKILAIGNSFSSDSMQYVYDVAMAAGVQDIYLGNMYIGGCTLATHLKNAQDDSASYTYYTNQYGGWVTTSKAYKLSDAIKSQNWDFITFQQASTFSGNPETYDDLKPLMDILLPLCTNPKVEIAWHMTWAYAANSSSVGRYGTQMDMYNAIVSSVQSKIVPNTRITKIIPNGTAIQNARSSFVGDNLNRDGSHLSLDRGRFIAGLTTIEALIGIDWTTFDMTSLYYVYPTQRVFFVVAEESAKNAVKTKFEVTESRY